MTTGVRLLYRDGHQEMVHDAHVHGLRGGRLLVVSGEPGQGVDPEVIRAVDVGDLEAVMTLTFSGQTGDAAPEDASWRMDWGDASTSETTATQA